MDKKAFLICPVRGVDQNGGLADQTTNEIFVSCLEAEGWTVHYPARDTPQDDTIGLSICETNCEAIRQADRVFVVWDGKSTGSLFDLGMAFALGKPLTVLHMPEPTEGKSFQNMCRAWAAKG